jgi:uncharacterized surface protein with fasciclin (FAS1) repeats
MQVKFLKSKSLAVLMFAGLAMMSCNNDDDNPTPPAQQNITELVVAGSNFTILEAAVLKAGLDSALRGTGPFTVFAPNDAAFAALPAPFNSAASITAITRQGQIDTLRQILQYHVVRGRVASADITGVASRGTATLRTGTDSLYVSKVGNTVSVNGVAVTTADQQASNGVIHTVNRVLMPPMGSIAQVASGNTNFNILVAAVTRADLAGALGGNTPYTVFAPTDSAFLATLRTAFSDNSLTEEQAISRIGTTDINTPLIATNTNSTLLRILQYHVVPGRNFSSTLSAGTVPTLLGANATLTVALNPVTVKGATNQNPSRVVTPDLTASNGVIHVINEVLIPAGGS